MFTTTFYSELSTISHYTHYPSMMPFVGKNYANTLCKRILLIGESHYLPEDSNASLNAESWYSSNESILRKDEKAWVNTREILSCEWDSPGHFIFRELNNRMTPHVPIHEGRSMNSCAFMNGFQRPSPQTGESIKSFCTLKDFEESSKTIKEVILILRPQLVIFTSVLAWRTLGWRVQKEVQDVKMDFVCHPGTGGRYWHKVKYPNGVNKFVKLVSE